jgi:hypothetical protein
MSKFKVGDVVRIAHKDKYDDPLLLNGLLAKSLREKDLIVIFEEDSCGDYFLKVSNTGFWVNRDDLVKGECE